MAYNNFVFRCSNRIRIALLAAVLMPIAMLGANVDRQELSATNTILLNRITTTSNSILPTATQIASSVNNAFSNAISTNLVIDAQWIGVSGDGANQFSSLVALNRFLYTNDGMTVRFPRGTIGTSNSAWMMGVRNVHLDFAGSVLSNTLANPYSGYENFPLTINSDPGINRDLGATESGRPVPYLIGSIAKGATNCTLTTATDATNFAPGIWIGLYGYEQQGSGWPRNYRFVEYLKCIAVVTNTGEIQFDRPTRHFYDANWFKLATDNNIGPASILPLERSGFRFAENVTVENLVVAANNAETNSTANGATFRTSSSFNVGGVYNFVGRNIRGEQLTVGTFENARFDNCEFNYANPDKQGGYLEFHNCTFTSIAEGTGIDTIVLDGCTITGTLALFPRRLIVRNCTLYSAPSLANGWNATEIVFENNTFVLPPADRTEILGGFATEGGGTYPDAPAPGVVIVTDSNSATRFTASALADNYTLRLAADFGTVLHTANGLAVITNITFSTNLTSTNFLVDYVADRPILNGERLYYHYAQTIVERGTYKQNAATGVPLSQQWKPAELYESVTDGTKPDGTFDFTISGFSSNALMYRWVDGLIDDIWVDVQRPYTGSGDTRLEIAAYLPTGTPWPTALINLTGAGVRHIGDTIDGMQSGDTLPTRTNSYLYSITIRALATDNLGTNAWSGTVRIKGHSRTHRQQASSNPLARLEHSANGFSYYAAMRPATLSAGKLLRTDASTNITEVTIGSGISFDGTTLSGTVSNVVQVPASQFHIGGTNAFWSTNLGASALVTFTNMVPGIHYWVDITSAGYGCTVSNSAAIQWRDGQFDGFISTNGSTTLEVWINPVSGKTNGIITGPEYALDTSDPSIGWTTNNLLKTIRPAVNGNSVTNLKHGNTVSAGDASVTVTRSLNADGSTNFSLTASGGGGGWTAQSEHFNGKMYSMFSASETFMPLTGAWNAAVNGDSTADFLISRSGTITNFAFGFSAGTITPGSGTNATMKLYTNGVLFASLTMTGNGTDKWTNSSASTAIPAGCKLRATITPSVALPSFSDVWLNLSVMR